MTAAIGPLPGVTSIVRLQETLIGGDLATWGANEAVNAILEARPWAKGSDEQIRATAVARVQRARTIGTVVHAAIAELLTGGHPTPTPETAPYLYAYAAFLAERRPEYLAIEQRVIHRAAGYGGTFDFIARIDRKVGLGDIKTGKQKVTHRLQLGGYLAAEGTGPGVGIDGYHRYWYTGGEVTRLPRTKGGWILYLSPDGYELVEQDVTRADKRHFLALVRAYHLLRQWQNGKEPTKGT